MALRPTTFLDSLEYRFAALRAIPEHTLNEGVIFNPQQGVMDVFLTPSPSTLGGMRLDVSAGQALVKGLGAPGATGLSNGLYHVVNDAGVQGAATLAASHATLPRIDQLWLTIGDTTDLGSSSDVAAWTVVTGTPTAGATLDNRLGAGARPVSGIRLADILVPAGSSTVTVGNMRARMTFATPRELAKDASAGIASPLTTTPVIIPGCDIYVDIAYDQLVDVEGQAVITAGGGTNQVQVFITSVSPAGEVRAARPGDLGVGSVGVLGPLMPAGATASVTCTARALGIDPAWVGRWRFYMSAVAVTANGGSVLGASNAQTRMVVRTRKVPG